MASRSWLLATTVMIGSVTGVAHAATNDQGVVTNAAAGSDSSGTDEIIVTAQKRAQNINNVGMSITAATGEQLLEKGVATISDLTRIEPSLQFSQSSYGTPVYTIRGVGYFDQSLAAASTVSVYLDEVPYPFPVMSRGALLDVDRVEILKGPQGTLYGQNATAGGINFIAAKPTDTFSAGLDVVYGRFGETRLNGFLSGPLTPTLNFRLAAGVEAGGAWQKSQTRNDSLGNKDTQSGRLILDWKPAENFKASLNVNGWLDRSDTQAAQLAGIYFVAPQYISPNQLTPPSANRFPNPAYFATYPAAIRSWINTQPTNPSSAREADWDPAVSPRRNAKFYQVSLRLDYSLSDLVGLTSLTSYQNYNQDNIIDEGGIGKPYVYINIKGEIESFFQELRLHGDSGDGRLNWLVGVNYAKDNNKEFTNTVQPGISGSHLTGGSTFSRIQLHPFSLQGDFRAKTTTKSVFGNVDFRIMDTLSFHGGIRYTRSDQAIANCSLGDDAITSYLNIAARSLAAANGGATPTPVFPGQCITMGPPPNFQPGLYRTNLNEDNIPWRVGIDWTPSKGQLFYVAVSRGYKAGSAPSLGATFYRQFQPVTQESLLSYEVGGSNHRCLIAACN
jgi:iron complex outermembrane recepter protein